MWVEQNRTNLLSVLSSMMAKHPVLSLFTRALIFPFILDQFLSCCNLTFSHSCKCKNSSRTKKKKRTSPGSGEGREGMEKQGLLPCIVLLLIPPHRHTKTFDTFQWLGPTLPVTPTHSGVTQTHTTRTHTHVHRPRRFKVFPRCVQPACQTAWNLPLLSEAEAPASPSSFAFIHFSKAPPSFGAPIRPLCRSMACG